MGKLAMWGAVGGLGKGMMQNAEYQQRVDFAELEAAREQKLRQFTADRDDQREARREAYDASSREKEFERDTQKEAARQAGNVTNTLLGADREDARSKAEREARSADVRYSADTGLKAAQIRADASGKGSAKGQFQIRNIPVKTFTADGLPATETIVPGTFDKASGATYVQEGDKFYLLGKGNAPDKQVANSARTPRPGEQALNALRDDPGLAYDFINKYGYLPLWWKRYATIAAEDDKQDSDE